MSLGFEHFDFEFVSDLVLRISYFFPLAIRLDLAVPYHANPARNINVSFKSTESCGLTTYTISRSNT